jgi:predicted nucleic acid-binding protein
MPPEPVVLDTDTLSELCRGNLRVKERARSYLEHFGRLTTTAVTVFERRRGYQLAIRGGKPFHRQLQAFEGLIASCLVLPFDRDAASLAAKIWAAVPRARRQQLGDILIAGTAASRQLPLVTRNRFDFTQLSEASGIPLRLADWTTAPRGS